MKKLGLLLVVAVLGGCANLADGLGAAALSIDTVANTIADECGNATAQSGCTADSLITTRQAYEARVELQKAQDAVVDGNAALNAGNNADASSKLSIANAVIASVKATLKRRGVETE